MATDRQLQAALDELHEFTAHNADAALRRSDIARRATATLPEGVDLEAQDLRELHSSKLYDTLDHLCIPAPFPLTSRRICDLNNTQFWLSLGLFAYAKAVVLNSDTLEAHVQWLRDIMIYIRDSRVIPPERTSDAAMTRIITGLAYQHRFRQRLRDLRAASILKFPLLFTDVVTYIFHDHFDPAHERKRARRVIAVEDVPLDAPPPKPAVPAVVPDPPPYKARHHKASVEYLDEGRLSGRWSNLVCDTFRVALHLKDAPAPQRRLEVLQFTLRCLKDTESAETPYFDDISAERLSAVLEKDAGFTAVMDELLCAVDGDYSVFSRILRRIVNHVCQPRKRAQGGSRRVRFAPV
ncbi:hypothetical protein AURDEDRAFT_152943 [Auricularia subglabra TFB-10046 SS5]|nr:hypothetical protein AURDEDRAFT_152943 [Auricularia subglabra TFB-10046 SS5]